MAVMLAKILSPSNTLKKCHVITHGLYQSNIIVSSFSMCNCEPFIPKQYGF